MTDDVLPDFGRSEEMILPSFDGPAQARLARETAARRLRRSSRRPDSGLEGVPVPEYPPAVDFGMGGAPRTEMTLGENIAGSFQTNTILGIIAEAASMEAARGAPQPGGFQPSQMRNLPTRVRQRIEAESTPEDAARRRDAAMERVFQQSAYDLSQSRITPQSVAGTIIGALADPANVVSLPANALRRLAAPIAGRLGPAAGRIAEGAVDAAVVNTAVDPILQAGRLQSGAQEAYSPEQTALAPVVGGAAGGLLRGAIEAPSFVFREIGEIAGAPRSGASDPVAASPARQSDGAPGQTRDIGGSQTQVEGTSGPVQSAGAQQREADAVSTQPDGAAPSPRQPQPDPQTIERYKEAVSGITGQAGRSAGDRRASVEAYQRAHDALRDELVPPGSELYLRSDGTLYQRGSLWGEFDNIMRRDLADADPGQRAALERRADEIIAELSTLPPGARPVTAADLAQMRQTTDDAGVTRYMPANDAEPQQFAAMARQQGKPVTRADVERIVRENMPDSLAAMSGARGAGTTAGRRFPTRMELPGEATKPRALPPDIKPEDVRDFRVTEAMRSIAEAMNRKLEVDGRFSLRNAEGQYDRKQGVLRIRKEGDYEVFSHEFGHGLEDHIRASAAGKDFVKLLRASAAELRPLDLNNAGDPAKQTVTEGFAEFVRMFINNPAYAERRAPNFAAAFTRLLDEKAPDIAKLVREASLISRIDSGLDPVQSIKSTIAPAIEPRGAARFLDEWDRLGLPRTFRMWSDRAYAAVVDRGHWVKRVVQSLAEARWQKTGQPMPEAMWGDPVKMFRKLDGAKQAAVDAFQYGVRGYRREMDGPESASLYDALKEAGGGLLSKIVSEDSEVYRDFNAYLIARRALGEYERFNEGLIPQPPVRQTEAEVRAALRALENANPTFRAAADKVFSFSRAMLRKKFEAGLVSKEFYDAVTARGIDYVPFFRDMMDGANRGTGGARNGVQQSLEGPRFTGSSRDILDPIQSLMLDTARSERVIALNDFWTAMHMLAKQGGEFSGRFLEEIPNTEIKGLSVDIEAALMAKAKERGLSPEDTQNLISSIEEMVGEDMTATLFRSQEILPSGDRIVFRYEAGKRIAMKLGNDEYSRQMFDIMSQMSAAERDIMMAMFGKANAMFSQFITNAPQFALKNLIMDNLSRIFVARNAGLLGRVPFAGLAIGIYTHIFDKEFSRAYARMGGIRGGVVSAAARDLERSGGLEAISLTPQGTMASVRDIIAGVERISDVGPAALKLMGRGVEGYFKLIEASETAGRLGQAKIVYQHLKKQGLSDYEAMHGAIYEARDVLDYDRRGTAMKVATRFMPFFNVGIQSVDRGLRNLVADPLAAAIQAYKRGGMENVDEAGRRALQDAVLNWGMIAAGVVLTLGYHAVVSNDPTYRRQSDYMRRRYYILPMGERQNGDPLFISLPKPFDLPGAILSAVEAASDGIKRADPEAWGRVAKALEDGFLPRHLTGLQDFFGSQPVPKVAMEYLTGRRIGFEGSPPSDIVPMGMRGLRPEDQWTANTSYLAKRIGEATGGSPLMIDHVMNGLGATAARDLNDVITATFDSNPNMTPGDAFTKLFFGGLYRRQRGIGSDRSEVTQLMGRDGAKYMAPALSYAHAVERGDQIRADQIYRSADDLGKALMTLRGHSFSPVERQMHPLQSAETWASLIGMATRDLSQNRIEVQNRSRKRGEQREFIEIPSTEARSIINTLNAMAAEQIRNGLSIAGVPGYQAFPIIEAKPRLDAIRALNRRVADEIEARIQRANIIPADHLKANWPEVMRRLTTDRQLADLSDLVPSTASEAARRNAARSRRTRQRVEENNAAD